MWKDNLAFFYKSKLSQFFVQVLTFTKSLLVYQQISMTRFVLTIGTSSTHQWVPVIPDQIILVKQIKIHVY